MSTPLRNPTAFVSWAHRQAVWNNEQAADGEQKIVTFAGLLRAAGIDADVDAFHYHDADVDWTRYGPAQIEEREFTLIALSEGWRERWDGTNDPTEGAGAVAEANALLGIFGHDQQQFRQKVKLILLRGVPDTVVPQNLNGVPRFRIGTLVLPAWMTCFARSRVSPYTLRRLSATYRCSHLLVQRAAWWRPRRRLQSVQPTTNLIDSSRRLTRRWGSSGHPGQAARTRKPLGGGAPPTPPAVAVMAGG